MRLFNTVGPRQTGKYGMVVPRFVRQAMANNALTVYGDGSQRRCFGYVGDVVGAIIKLSEHPGAIGRVFNIGSTEEVSIEELTRRVIKLVGSNSESVKAPYSEAYEEGFEDFHKNKPLNTSSIEIM